MRKVFYWDKASQRMVETKPQEAVERVHIIEDTMKATKHPANGKIYESKSSFRRETKARGLEEVGNDWVNKPAKPVEPRFRDSTPILRELLDKL